MDPRLVAVNKLIWRKDPVEYFKDITGLEPIPEQQRLLRSMLDFKNTRFLICCASGVGKTRTLATIAEWHATEVPDIIKQPYKIAILSGSQKQSDELYNWIIKDISRSPYLASQLAREPLKSYVVFKNGSSIVSLPASPTAYHGIHVNLLIVDEAEDACLKDPKLIIDAPSRIAGMPYSRLILSSTPYYGELFCKYYYETENYPEWLRFHWNTYECPWISQEEIEWAREHTPSLSDFKIRWLGEYSEEEAPTMFRRKSILELKHPTKPSWDEKHPTYLLIDWGYKPHATGIVVCQKIGNKYIILESQLWKEVPYPEQIKRIIALADRYHVTEVRADSENVGECQRLKELGLPVKPISFRADKPRMLEGLRAAVEEGRLYIWEGEDELLRELAYYNPDKGKGDDLVDALMMAMLEDIRPQFNKWHFRAV